MVNEFLRIFRRYCELSQEAVASAARISLEKYKQYEYGLDEPDKETMKRLLLVLGLPDSIEDLEFGTYDKSFEIFAPKKIDANMFKSTERCRQARLLINLLSEKEKQLVLLYRTASLKYKNKILSTALKSLSCADQIAEDNLTEYLLMLEGSYTKQADFVAEHYNMPKEDALNKTKEIFESVSWDKIKQEAEELINKRIREAIDSELSGQAHLQ